MGQNGIQSAQTVSRYIMGWFPAVPPHLGRHVHEQHRSHWSLSLAVAFIGPVDGVGLQDPEQILLSAGMEPKRFCLFHIHHHYERRQ